MVVYTLLLATPAMAWFGSYVWFSSRDALIERTFQQLISVRVEKQQNLEQFFESRLTDALRTAASATAPALAECFSETATHDDRAEFILPGITLLRDSAFLSDVPLLPVLHSSPVYALVVRTDGSVSQYPLHEACLNQIMVNKNPYSGLGVTGEAYLTGADSLMRSSSRFHHNAILKTKVVTTGILRAMDGETGTGIYTDYRGVKILGSYAQFHYRGLKWVLVAEIDQAEALMPVVKLGRNILFMGIFAALAIFAAVWLAARTITRPLVRLRDAAEKISDGNYEQHLDLKSGDETGALTESFNNMALTLKAQSVQIHEERLHRMRAIIDGQELERQRLSREIHDSLGQNLLAVNMLLQRTAGCHPDEIRQFTHPAGEIVKDAIAEARAIINNLRPPALTELGLVEAVRNLCRDAEITGNIQIEATLTAPPLPDTVAIYLYRIVQEALHNILKHAKASRAEVRIEGDTHAVGLHIHDNGQGFDARSLPSGSNGLNNMRERIQILGGEFNITTSPGNGTIIHVNINTKHD